MLALAATLLLALGAAPDAGTKPATGQRAKAKAAKATAPVDPAELLPPLPARFVAPSLEVPGALESVNVPGTEAMGVPVQLRAVRSSEKLEVLIAHFQRTFLAADLFVVHEDDVDNPGPLPHVTALDPFSNTSWTVLFQPNLDGTTTVLIGTAFLHARRDETSPLPLYPGAAEPLVTRTEAGRTIAYNADATEQEVAAFYQEALKAGGFQEIAPGRYERVGEAVEVYLKARSPKQTGVILLEQQAGEP